LRLPQQRFGREHLGIAATLTTKTEGDEEEKRSKLYLYLEQPKLYLEQQEAGQRSQEECCKQTPEQTHWEVAGVEKRASFLATVQKETSEEKDAGKNDRESDIVRFWGGHFDRSH
jgi:hypothetical protein